MSQKFIIDNIEKFTDSARMVVFNSFGKEEMAEDPDGFMELLSMTSQEERKELDSVLTHKESLLIVEQNARKQVNKNTKEVRYLIDEKIFADILEALNSRMVSNLLANLSRQGLIESAYDDKINDFVFWTVDPKSSEDSSN
jgi:regulator of PEP synthase PpsR (kinase-PPPase family)